MEGHRKEYKRSNEGKKEVEIRKKVKNTTGKKEVRMKGKVR